MKKINQELIALFDKYGSDRRRALRENKKLSYLYALADLRENLLDWCQFDPEQQALQIGADAGALTGLLARRLSSVTVLDASENDTELTIDYRPLEKVVRSKEIRLEILGAPAGIQPAVISFTAFGLCPGQEEF